MSRWRGMLRKAVDQPLIASVARIERFTLIAVILAAAILFAFAVLGNAVGLGSTRAFDEWLILALRTPADLADPIGPKRIEERG